MGRDVNGVFKGGGAKGIAYAGALAACESSGLRFRAVAGSSAGAITATLVACGYSASEIIERMPSALRTIDNPATAMLKLWRPSLLRNAHLCAWLRAAIAERVHGPDADPSLDCTFAEIERSTGIELYVVTLDLATNQPRVFCPALTPDSPVAPAVVASSAIPVAFPAARMDVGGRVHRVVDGGTWSNYPAFVFLDDEFRCSAGLEPTELPTIGFILDDADDEPSRPVGSPTVRPGRSLIGDRGSSAARFQEVGAVLSSTVFRWTLGLIPILFVLLSVSWLHGELNGASSAIERLPTWLHDLAIVGAVGVLAATGLASVVFVFVIVRLGNSLFDSGLVGASAAMGVGPGVAYWVGSIRPSDGPEPDEPRHVAVRIPVPRDLTTLRFSVGPDVQRRAVAAGHDATVAALAALTAPRRASITPVTDPAPRRQGLVPVRAIRWVLHQFGHRWWLRGLALAYAIVGGITGTLRVIEAFADGEPAEVALWMLVVGSAIVVAVWLIATMRMQEVDDDEPYRFLRRVGSPRVLSAGSVVAGLLAATVFVAIGTENEMSFFSATRAPRVTAEVISVDADDDGVSVIDVAVTGDRQPDDAAYDTFVDLVFAADADDGFVDLAGEPVSAVSFGLDGGITTLDDVDAGELLLELATFREIQEGDVVELGVDTADDVVFLADDRIDDLESDDSLIGAFVIGVGLLAASFRSWRAARWLRQQPSEERPASSARRAPSSAPEDRADALQP